MDPRHWQPYRGAAPYSTTLGWRAKSWTLVFAACFVTYTLSAGPVAAVVEPGCYWIKLVGRAGCVGTSGWLGGFYCSQPRNDAVLWSIGGDIRSTFTVAPAFGRPADLLGVPVSLQLIGRAPPFGNCSASSYLRSGSACQDGTLNTGPKGFWVLERAAPNTFYIRTNGRSGCAARYLGAVTPQRSPPTCGNPRLGLYPKAANSTVLLTWQVIRTLDPCPPPRPPSPKPPKPRPPSPKPPKPRPPPPRPRPPRPPPPSPSPPPPPPRACSAARDTSGWPRPSSLALAVDPDLVQPYDGSLWCDQSHFSNNLELLQNNRTLTPQGHVYNFRFSDLTGDDAMSQLNWKAGSLPGSSMSAAVWVRLERTDPFLALMFMEGVLDKVNNTGVNFDLQSSQLGYSKTGTSYYLDRNIQANTNCWYFTAVSIDGGAGLVRYAFMDQVQNFTTGPLFPTAFDSLALPFVRSAIASGSLGPVAVWNVALTDAQLVAVYNRDYNRYKDALC